MKALSILLLFTATPIFAYTFTNPEGKSFDGEILRVQSDTVVIERSVDHRPFNMPLNKLSAVDQAYVTKWKEENPDLKLTFNVTKETQNIDVKGSNQESDECFKIEVKNGSPEAIPPLKLYYTITKRSTGDLELITFENSKEKISGSTDIPSIQGFRSETVHTSSVHVGKIASTTTTTTRERNNQTTDKVTTKKALVIVKGINFVVHFNNREVARWCTGGLQDQVVDLKAAGFSGKP